MKSYFRFLSRNKLYAIIEAFGLAFSLGLRQSRVQHRQKYKGC